MLGINNVNIQEFIARLQTYFNQSHWYMSQQRKNEAIMQQVKKISADDAINEAEINALVKPELEVQREGVSDWIGEMEDRTKSDAVIAARQSKRLFRLL